MFDQHGIQFKLSDGAASPTLTTVAKVASITPPNMTRETFPAPTHDDSGAIKKLVAALYDAGQFTLELVWNPAAATHDNATGLLEAFETADERDNQLVFPDSGATTWTVPSVVVGFQVLEHAANGGAARATVTLEVTDTPTLA